jgi:hypothetical protein
MKHRQFTMKIEDGLLAATKKHAIEHGLTVSDIVRDHLTALTGWTPTNAVQDVKEDVVIDVLNRYSAKEISRSEAMAMIGLRPDETERFAQLMNDNAIAWPAPDKDLTSDGAAALLAAMNEDQ